MNFSTYRFTLDLQRHQSQMSIAVSRYDTAVRLCISLTDGGNPYFIEDGCIAVLWGKKANGSPISHACMIESNTRIVYDFNESTADEPGIVNCQIRLYKDGNEIITAPKFIIVVDERIVKDEDIDLESGEFTKDELSSLDNLLLQESARVAAEIARETAEKARETAEKERKEAENKRQADLNNKLDKTTEANKIYGTGKNGGQTSIPYSSDIVFDSIVQRSKQGDIYVSTNPGRSDCATSVAYVRLEDERVREDIKVYVTEKLTEFVNAYIASDGGAIDKLQEIASWIDSDENGVADIITDILNKLDKTTEANKIYGTDAKGNQTTLPVDTFAKRKAHNPNFYTALGYGATPEETTFIMSGSATPNSIVYRDGSGNFKVNTPTDDSHPAPKGYADKKVAKINQSWILYGNGANATPNYYHVSEATYPQNIVRRDMKSDILVIDEPVSDNGATSKKYVNGLVNPIEERVSELESLTLTFTEDKTVAYNKSVPANVGKYARIKSVGGATKKAILSKNEIDPRKVKVTHRDYPEQVIPHTINADGSISFKLGNQSPVATIRYSGLPIGTYEYKCICEGGDGFFVGDPDYLMFEFYANINEEEQTYEETTIKAYLLCHLLEAHEEDVAYGFAGEAKEFEPFREGFKNAEVSKIESRGANLIPFPYDYEGTIKGVGYKETNKGITYEVLENGLISMVGTSTSVSTFQIFRKIMPKGDYFISGGYPSGGLMVGSYNYDAPNYDSPQNGIGTINQKFTHAGGAFGAYIKIDKGVTVNSVYSPIITRDVYVKDFKPYKAEPINTFTIPVEAIKALVDENGKPKVVDFGKGIDTTDYNYIECIDGKWYNWQKCKELVLTGKEQYITHYGYGGMNGVSIQYLLDTNYNRAKAICTDTDKTKESDTTINSMWLGSSNTFIYWVGVLDYLGLSNVDEFRAYLTRRYESGNPVRILYKLATPKVSDITEAFKNGYKIQVEQGGTLIPVNDNKLPVPSNIAYVTRKG